jgi:general secretion pathway protein G
MPTRQRTNRRRTGFTLMEVLLVLVIIVILGSLAVGMFTNTQARANIRAAKAQVGLLKTPLNTYFLDMNEYPTTAQGLDALRRAPSDVANPAKWGGPYLDQDLPPDPWGRPYQYAYPGTRNVDSFDIWSLGPDGQDGTADDVGNWPETVVQ